MSPGGVVLLLAGASLEFVGLALVALENVDIRRTFNIRHGRANPVSAGLRVSAFGARVEIAGPEPTIEERISRLASQVTAIDTRLSELAAELPAQMRQQWSADVGALRDELTFQLDEVRRLIGMTVQPTQRRWVGLGAFALGLILQTAANLVG
jgi:hypothetical protein